MLVHFSTIKDFFNKLNFSRKWINNNFFLFRIFCFRYDGLDATLVFNCNILLKGKYKATGRVLIFQINGDGDAKIKTRMYM